MITDITLNLAKNKVGFRIGSTKPKKYLRVFIKDGFPYINKSTLITTTEHDYLVKQVQKLINFSDEL